MEVDNELIILDSPEENNQENQESVHMRELQETNQSDLRHENIEEEDSVDHNVPTPKVSSSQESSTATKVEDEDDGSICPICLDYWTSSGEQRLCSLKCGHVFCHRCVLRWLGTLQQKSCPTCKKKANKSDIRYIFAKKLVAIDNSELEALKKQLNLVMEEKNNIQLDLSKYISREIILKQNITELKSHIQELSNKEITDRSLSVRYNDKKLNPSSLKIFMEKSLEICPQNGCRVFDSSSILGVIMVSAKSSNNLFSGFGIRIVNISQYKPLAFIPLHQQQIRDVCIHPNNNWLLTVSMDKSFKVTDALNNKINFTCTQNVPLWSCCWDTENENILYIGTQSGSVIKYDLGRLEEPICTLSIPGDMSPVVSIASVSPISGPVFPFEGIICCKLNSLWFFENLENDYIKHSLSLSGPFVSMKYDNKTKHLLVSSRPNNLVSHSRHILCNLSKNLNGAVNCDIIRTFSGGGMQKLLSKSCFVFNKQEYVAAYDELNKCVFLWNVETGEKMLPLPASEPVLDLRGIQTSNGNFLVSLSESKMRFFRFN